MIFLDIYRRIKNLNSSAYLIIYYLLHRHYHKNISIIISTIKYTYIFTTLIFVFSVNPKYLYIHIQFKINVDIIHTIPYNIWNQKNISFIAQNILHFIKYSAYSNKNKSISSFWNWLHIRCFMNLSYKQFRCNCWNDRLSENRSIHNI